MRNYRRCWMLIAIFIVSGSATQASAVSIIPLGNLFDDPKLTDLTTAIASDTFGASASAADLGVEIAAQGVLGADVLIAPSITFNFVSAGGGSGSFGGIRNDSAYNTGAIIRTTGVSMPINTLPNTGQGPGEQGIGMHADSLLTFDLDEIRTAGSLDIEDTITFTADAGDNDDTSATLNVGVVVSDATGVLAGYINGDPVAVSFSAGAWSFTGAIPTSLGLGSVPETALFDLDVPSSAKWLTLVSLNVNGIGSDQAVFSEAQLNVTPPVPEPSSLMLLGIGACIVARRARRRPKNN